MLFKTNSVEIQAKALLACSRRLPINLENDDLALFSHELDRRFIGGGITLEKSVAIISGFPFRYAGLEIFGEHVFAGEVSVKTVAKRYYDILKGVRKPVKKIGKATWILDNWSEGYFHWFADALSRAEYAIDHLIEFPLILPERLMRFEYVRDSLKVLGIPCLVMDAGFNYQVEQMLFPGHVAPTGNFNKIVLNRLAQRFRSCISKGREPVDVNQFNGRRIFISRSCAERRKIINEQDLLDVLQANSFELIVAEKISFSEQCHLFSNAAAIVGLHGAGLTNMIFMPTGGKVVEIRRRHDASNNCYFAMASDLGLDYYYLQADLVNGDLHSGDCMLDPSALDRLLSTI